LKAVSILNQAALVEKLLKDRGYDVEYRRGITAWEIRDEELKSLLIMTVAAPAHVHEYIWVFHYAKRDAGKPVALYVTIEGIPYKAAIQGSGLERLEYIANSEFTADCLRKVGLNVIDVIHHAIDMDLAKKVISETEKRRNPFDRFLERRFGDICKLIYVGRHDPRKGLPLLAEAMRMVHKKWKDKYVLVMISEPEAKKYFEGLNVYWLTNFGNLTYEHTLMAMKACDYLVFPSMCVPPSTNIVCWDRVKPIEDVRVGDLVLTHKGRFRRVTRVYKRFYVGELIGIRPRKFNKTIWLTPEHPILVANITWRWTKPSKWSRYPPDFTTTWVRAKDLTTNHAVVVPKVIDREVVINSGRYLNDIVEKEGLIFAKGRNQFGAEFIHPQSKPIPCEINPSDEFLKLAGYYIAEGCQTKDGIALCFGALEKQLIKDGMNLMKLFDMNPRFRVLERNRSVIYGSHRLYGNLFGNLFGKKSHEKRIPPFMLQMDRDKLTVLINAMFAGDGHINKNGLKEYTTVSEELAISTFLAIAKLGFLPSFYDETSVEHGYIVKWKEKARTSYAKQDENYLFLPISHIERRTYRGYVYNLEVEEDNSYVAEVIAVHNCEGFGLPVLEANSLGVPAIHSWFPPLSEFSSQEFNFVFNYLLERPMKTRSGQFFIMHEYVPDMLADMIDYALDVFYNSREEYEDYSAKAIEHASRWDYRLIYPRLLDHLGVE